MGIHGYIDFRGVTAHLDGQFVFAHGIAPSQLQLRVPPLPSIEEGGTLTLVYGGTRIAFPQCKVDRVDVSRTADGLVVWTMTVLDRRWKWKECGQISGYYNVREGESSSPAAGVPKSIRKGTEKNIKALMKLCLEAMGELGYDLSRVPTDVYPEVEWDYALPAEALAKLADSIGFRVVLSLRNRVELWPEGQGQKLSTSNAIEYQLTVDPPERPDQLVFVGSRVLWEMDLELEPVARTAAGVYQPLDSDKIEYRPKVSPINGSYWHSVDLEFCNAIFDTPVSAIDGVKTYRELAKADVFRKYRIKTPFNVDKPSGAKGFNGKIEQLDRILPLLGTRLRTGAVNGVAKPLPPAVWGLYSREDAKTDYYDPIASSRSKIGFDFEPDPQLRMEGGFQVDETKGIVAFDKPRFQLFKKQMNVDGKKVDASYLKAAQLFLRIGFGVRDPQTRGWFHQQIVRKGQGRRFGTQPRYVTAEDTHLRGIENKTQVEFNDADYEIAAKHYLDKEEKRYEQRDPCAATYPGLLAVNPDGAIQQITWAITERGCTTRVSRNREEPVLGLTYSEQRLYQQIAARLDADVSAKAADELRRKRPS